MGEDFSAYAYEKEVLLLDGLEFYVLEFEYKINDQNKEYAHVKLYNTGVNKISKNSQVVNDELVK